VIAQTFWTSWVTQIEYRHALFGLTLCVAASFFRSRRTHRLKELGPVVKTDETKNMNKGGIMKRTMLTLVCALIAPLAFAQTSSTTTQKKTTTGPGVTSTDTATTTTEGTVTTFTPGKTIVVKTTAAGPVTYELGKTVRYVDNAGKEIKPSMIKPGTRVHVYYDMTGNTEVVNRVMVEE